MRASGKFSGELRRFESGEARGVVGAEAVLAFIGRQNARFENARDRLRVTGLGPDGRERVVRREAFVGPIEDFPVAELAASAEAEAARADAAQREGDHF